MATRWLVTCALLTLAITMPSPVRSAPLMVVLCTDTMMCDGFANLGGLNFVANVEVTTTDVDAIAGAPLTAPPGAQQARGTNNIDAVMLKIATPAATSSSNTPPANVGTSDSAIFFALLSGIDVARKRVGNDAIVTMLLVPPALATGAAAASQYLSIPYMLAYYRPLPHTVTSNGETRSILAASGEPLLRGSIQYALGGVAYVVGAVAAEMSAMGAVALCTGPLREPSVTMHLYVRESFRTHCPTCALHTFYFDPDVMGNASRFVAAVTASRVAEHVDLLLIEASTSLTQDIRALLQDSTIPLLAQLTVLCVVCNNGATQVTMQPSPLVSAIRSAHVMEGPVEHTVLGFESGLGVSLAPTCGSCLSERALRTYADTTTALATLFETRGGFAGVEETLLSIPLAKRTDGDTHKWVTALVRSFADDPGVVPLSAPPLTDNFSGAPLAEAHGIGTAAVASTCFILNQIEEAHAQTEEEAECVMVLVSEELHSVAVLQSGWTEWVAPERRIHHAENLVSWLGSSPDHNLPMEGFSVDAVSNSQFIVFGGQRATELLPVPQSAMFMLTFGGTSPASFTSVELSILTPASSDVPPARAFHAHVVALRSGDSMRRLYIHGGKGLGEAILSDLWVYSVLDKSWRALASSGTPRFLHTMLFLPRKDMSIPNDDVLVVWSGQGLFLIDTAEQFLISQSKWFAAVDIPIRATACAVPLGATHIAFLERRYLTPCVLDALSWTFDCASSSDANVASTLPAEYLQQENYLSSLYCAGINARARSNNTVGLVVVPSTAVSSADVALAIVHAGYCPIPVVFANATTKDDALAPTASPTIAHTVSAASSSTCAECSLSPQAYVQQCASYCSAGSFPYRAVCWPCDVVTKTSIYGMWPWTNVSIPSGSDFFLTWAAACPASQPVSIASSAAFGVVTPVVIAVVLFVCGTSIGYFIWTLLFHPGNDKALTNAPLLPPITLVQVDIHGSAALWRADPAFHAQFLDEFYVAVHDAIVLCNAFHVRRVGDGILIACRTGIHAVRLVQCIRSKLRENLRRSVGQGKLGACIRRRQPTELCGDITAAVQSNNDRVASSGHEVEEGNTTTGDNNKVEEHGDARTVQRLLHTVKCGLHTTSCLYVRRCVGAMEYEGDELLIPNAVLHSTKNGEISLTLDAISELEGLHRRHVAEGAHLRKGKKDTEYVEITLERILAMLSPSSSSGVDAPSAVEGGRWASDRRVCLDGTHVKVMKLACLEPPEMAAASGNHAKPASGIQPALSVCPPAPGVGREDASVGITSPVSEGLSLTVAANGNLLAMQTAEDLANNPIHRQLIDFYEYLDDTDMQIHSDISTVEFGAMRQIVAQILRAAILSLGEEMQSELMHDFSKYFVLATIDRSGADDLVAKSHEGRKIFLFERLAGRVMHILQPVRAKRLLLLCAIAGKTAAELGVGDFSTTQNTSRKEY